MKLVLGTVQFGLDYGISNKHGQTSPDEVTKILAIAQDSGICEVDTAALYGESERVLGRVLPRGFKIITKIPQLNGAPILPATLLGVRNDFLRSLEALNRQHLEGLLVHDANDLLQEGGEYLYNELQKLKQEKLVSKIGVSVYTSDQIEQLLARYPLDIVQLPINVLDQRMIKSGQLTALKNKKVEIYARSIFLQGLLLMPLDTVPRIFAPIYPFLQKYHQVLNDAGVSLLSGALNFLKGIPEIGNIVVGVNSSAQMAQIIEAFYATGPNIDYQALACSEEYYINPGNWPTLGEEEACR